MEKQEQKTLNEAFIATILWVGINTLFFLLGYFEFMKKKVAEEYAKGNITLSEAAHQASLNLWEMEKYLVEQGFKSSYSIEDLEKEMKNLG